MGGPGRVEGAQDIVFNRFRGTMFHQGHMLVCRRVKDHLGTVFLKDCIHGCAVLDITDKGYNLQAAKFQAQLLVGFINTVLAVTK